MTFFLYFTGYCITVYEIMECMLHCSKLCNEVDAITQLRWAGLKTNAEKLIGLHKHGDLFTTPNLETDRVRHYCHKQCSGHLGDKRRLEQAKKRTQMEAEQAQEGN